MTKILKKYRLWGFWVDYSVFTKHINNSVFELIRSLEASGKLSLKFIVVYKIVAIAYETAN